MERQQPVAQPTPPPAIVQSESEPEMSDAEIAASLGWETGDLVNSIDSVCDASTSFDVE